MTERQILLNLTKLVLVSDSVVLNTDLSFFPLSPKGPHTAATFFVSTSIFFNRNEFSINMSFEQITKLDKIAKFVIFKDVLFLTQCVETFD